MHLLNKLYRINTQAYSNRELKHNNIDFRGHYFHAKKIYIHKHLVPLSANHSFFSVFLRKQVQV